MASSGTQRYAEYYAAFNHAILLNEANGRFANQEGGRPFDRRRYFVVEESELKLFGLSPTRDRWEDFI